MDIKQFLLSVVVDTDRNTVMLRCRIGRQKYFSGLPGRRAGPVPFRSPQSPDRNRTQPRLGIVGGGRAGLRQFRGRLCCDGARPPKALIAGADPRSAGSPNERVNVRRYGSSTAILARSGRSARVGPAQREGRFDGAAVKAKLAHDTEKKRRRRDKVVRHEPGRATRKKVRGIDSHATYWAERCV
jgi:hypothetical protein